MILFCSLSHRFFSFTVDVTVNPVFLRKGLILTDPSDRGPAGSISCCLRLLSHRFTVIGYL